MVSKDDAEEIEDQVEDVAADETPSTPHRRSCLKILDELLPTRPWLDDAEDDERPTTPTIALRDRSAARLEDGEAPDGFTIKGNADSMKYHEPDGRWYESTMAAGGLVQLR